MLIIMVFVAINMQQLYAQSSSSHENVQTVLVQRFSYDQNGNLMAVYQDDTLVSGYQYNDLNQLEYFSDEKKSKTYLYHYYSNGQRSQKEDVSTGNVIHFYYGQKGKLLNEALTLTGEETKRSSYFAGNRFIRNISNQNDSTLQTPLAIRKNNPLSVDLSAGISTKESVHLDDYGLQSNENSQVNQSLPSGDKHPRMGAYEEDDFSFDRNPFVYGAGYYDSESGLNFQRARYYNPATQSFMAQDSKDLVNRYNYANSNPVMNYDPSGHNAISDAFHKGISALGGKGAVYGLNSAAMLTSIGSMGAMLLLPASPVAALAFAAEGVSFLAGGSAILAQASTDANLFDRQTAQKLYQVANVIALVDLPFSVAVGGLAVGDGILKRGRSLGVDDSILKRTRKTLANYRNDPYGRTKHWLNTSYRRLGYRVSSPFMPAYELSALSDNGVRVILRDKKFAAHIGELYDKNKANEIITELTKKTGYKFNEKKSYRLTFRKKAPAAAYDALLAGKTQSVVIGHEPGIDVVPEVAAPDHWNQVMAGSNYSNT